MHVGTEVEGCDCLRTVYDREKFSADRGRVDGSCFEVVPPSAYDFGDTHFGDVTNISL